MAGSMNIAIIGGGIAGTSFLYELATINQGKDQQIKIDLYDQGRGLGGRSSHRYVKEANRLFQFDHGCQFFRGDTPTMQKFISKFIDSEVIVPWRGNFVAHPSTAECDFFGMPFKGPFYVAAGGMHNFPLRLGEAAKKNGR